MSPLDPRTMPKQMFVMGKRDGAARPSVRRLNLAMAGMALAALAVGALVYNVADNIIGEAQPLGATQQATAQVVAKASVGSSAQQRLQLVVAIPGQLKVDTVDVDAATFASVCKHVTPATLAKSVKSRLDAASFENCGTGYGVDGKVVGQRHVVDKIQVSYALDANGQPEVTRLAGVMPDKAGVFRAPRAPR
jgi:hypothetical protein